jgi:hypothetical protein
MSRLYLSCEFCGRKQADGLLSRWHWGHLDIGNGGELRACPGCKQQYPDWEERLRATAGPPPSENRTVSA